MDSFSDFFGGEPVETVCPSAISEIGPMFCAAQLSDRAVIPWGGGTGQDYGYLPIAKEFVLLDLSGLNRIVAVEPGDLTITVEAGVTLAAIQEALLPYRLFLPLDPPHSERATVGGILATNAFGASRLGYGTARDWLIGLTVIDGQGRLVKSGGKVVKNVTGYDLPKLHTGALGTLGIIAEATFKVAPLPEATRTVILSWANAATLPFAFLTEVLNETAPVQAYLRSDSTGNYCIIVYAGFTEVVDLETARLRKAAESHSLPDKATITVFDETLQHEAGASPPLAIRFTGPLAEDHRRHELLLSYAQASGGVVETLLGCGSSEISWADMTEDSAHGLLKGIAPQVGASQPATGYAVLHAPTTVRNGDFALWSPEPPSLPLMRRVKESIDPKATLNTGRFIGRI